MERRRFPGPRGDVLAGGRRGDGRAGLVFPDAVRPDAANGVASAESISCSVFYRNGVGGLAGGPVRFQKALWSRRKAPEAAMASW